MPSDTGLRRSSRDAMRDESSLAAADGRMARFYLPSLALLLALFAIAAYGTALSLPFIGDDYVFLDKTRDAAFWDLWAFGNTDFGWYRPWSREFHFWALQKANGGHEVVFRVISMLLWVTALCLYAAVVRRLASRRVAIIATLGAASLAMWGTPLLWISGSQDLWMLCLAMASTLLFIRGRFGWGLLPFVFALLSKETAAVLPVLLGAYLVLYERRRLGDALRCTWAYWALTVAWLALHPTLHTRLLSGTKMTAEVEHRPPLLELLARTALSTVNLDSFPHPQEVGWEFAERVVASALILAAGVALATRGRPAVRQHVDGGKGTAALSHFALAWAAIGWFPLLLPSIGWHAYYGCLGALGSWVALANWLQDRRRLAIVVVASLAILRASRANTLSWDWGNESYQRRAGSTLSAIRDDLRRQYPALPRHSRVYFAEIPNNIGLIAGRSPAMRVWYRDSTLEAGFYSYYRPRLATTPTGEDFFFRFDSVAGMVQVRAGPEDLLQGLKANPSWEADHEDLAMLFLYSGDKARAGTEFEKLSLLPHRADAAVYAGVCWEAVGDRARADSLIAGARSRMGITLRELQAWLARLRRTLPARQLDAAIW